VGGGGTFVGCYVEGGGGGESRVGNGTTIIGGGLSASLMSETSIAAVFGVGGQHGSNYLVKGFNAAAYDGGSAGVKYPYAGIRVASAGNVYRCSTPGVPAGTAPTGTGAGIPDGDVRWDYLGPESGDGLVSLGSQAPGPQSRDFLSCQSPLDVGVSLGVVYRDRDLVFGNYQNMHCWEFGNTSMVTYGMSHNRTVIADWPMRPRPAMALVEDIYIGSTRHSASAVAPAAGVPTYLADTWNPGDLVWSKAAAVSAGGLLCWRCVTGGTFAGPGWSGTGTASSTGAAQFVLSRASQASSLNFQKEVRVGDYMLINGTTTVHVLADVNGDGLTFTTDMPVPAGTGMSIAPRPPVFEQVVALNSGPQTIAGAKTFSSPITAPGHSVTSYRDGSSTVGNQALDVYRGKAKIAAGQSSITITNSLVDTDSLVQAVIETDDATALLKNITKAAGSFTIRLHAAAAADTVVAFLVTN
jgi:hypothetical protein